jgi:hypothetical protein
MIQISEEQVRQVEYIIKQSIQGNHILFDPGTVREIFLDSKLEPSPELSKSYSVEHHIERIMAQPTLEQKRAYVDQLDPGTLELVIKTYFKIVESSLNEQQRIAH